MSTNVTANLKSVVPAGTVSVYVPNNASSFESGSSADVENTTVYSPSAIFSLFFVGAIPSNATAKSAASNAMSASIVTVAPYKPSTPL